MSASTVTLRPMLPADGPTLVRIFRSSIDDLTEDDYSDAQRSAWMSAADDDAAFAMRLLKLLTIVAQREGVPAGFASLQEPAHLEMLYVDPAFAGQGAGRLLCDAVEKIAAGRGAAELSVESSDTAEPFFRARGFQAQQRSTVMRGGEWLGRTKMTKTLATGASRE